MPLPLCALILEDRLTDAELAIHELTRFGYDPIWQRVETETAFRDALHPNLDLILADHNLPEFDALRALDVLIESGLDIPFIIVSGGICEELAVSALKRGAADYLLKDRLARLGPAVHQALAQRKLRQQKRAADARLRDSELRFRALIENSSDGIALFDADGIFRFATPAVGRILGCPTEDLIGQSGFALLHPEDRPYSQAQWERLLQEPGGRRTAQFRVRHRDGSWRWVERIATNLLDEPTVAAIIYNVRDISERKRLEGHEHEVRLVRAIQQSLLPSSSPNLAGLDIGGKFYPAGAAGGDYYDFLQLSGGLGLVIGDVSGHDLAAAMLMARTQSCIRCLGQTYRHSGHRWSDDLGRIVSTLNRTLSGNMGGDFFVTLMLGRFDLQTRELVCVGAGHPAAYVLDAKGKVKMSLASESVPLGISPDADFPASPSVKLLPGDLLLLLTDGIVEARAPDGTFFSAQRALDIVRVYRNDPAPLIVENLYQAVRAFAHSGPQADDITAIVVKVAA